MVVTQRSHLLVFAKLFLMLLRLYRNIGFDPLTSEYNWLSSYRATLTLPQTV